MAISTYTELKTEVADFSHRTDLTAKMDTFCILAEAVINKDLRTLDMETILSVTFNDAFYDLPADYMEIRAIHLENDGARVPIQSFSPQQLDAIYSRATGTAAGFAIHGGKLELRPAPGSGSLTGTTTSAASTFLHDSAASFLSDGISVGSLVTNTATGLTSTVLAVVDNEWIALNDAIFTTGIEPYSIELGGTSVNGEISYYKRVDTLTSNATNDILTKFPMIYLSAMMLQVYLYLQDDEELTKWASVYQTQISAANKSAQGGRYNLPQTRAI